MASDVGLGIAIVLLIAAAGFLGMAETGLTRMSEARASVLEAEGRRGSRTLARLARHPEQFLGPLLLLVLVCQLVAATLVGVLAERYLGAAGIALATALEVTVVFVLAEAAPKTWAVQHHDRAALLTAPIVGALARSRLVRLPTRFLVGLSNTILPGRGLEQGPFLSEAELLAVADIAAEHDVIERRERAWIRSVLDFGDTVVREVMVPRPDMVTVPATVTVREAVNLAVRSGLSRLPVVDPTIEDIAGIVYTRDLTEALQAERDAEPIRPMMHAAQFVPETKRVADLLADMQAGRFHMAIVVDEYGATAGLVTLEDLVEELVGEITDEYDVETPLVEVRPDGTALVSGRIRIDEVNEALGTAFPEDDWDTTAGFLCALLGHIPVEGESAVHGQHVLRAERVHGRRVTRIRIAAQPPTNRGTDATP